MTKDDIKEKLTELGIAYTEDMSKSDLEELLPIEEEEEEEEEINEESVTASIKREKVGDFEVGDPQVLRPVELPLVIVPGKGKSWKNNEQAAYAKNLNGYAYKNTTKWDIKKDVLLARLTEIGKDASAYQKYAGGPLLDDSLSYKNRVIEN